MSKKAFTLIGILLLAALTAAVGYTMRDKLSPYLFSPQAGEAPEVAEDTARVRIIARSLEVPWRSVTLPDSTLLVTERPGKLQLINKDGTVSIPVPGVTSVGEGGLLGIALHPRFKDNRYLYLYHTTKQGDGLINHIDRYVYRDGRLDDKTVILGYIPGAPYHDGGELAFGPDGYLYIGTGDAGNPDLAQDTQSLAGKILRITDDGDIPEDNPFGNAIYSLGHRNVQGLAWDEWKRLWAIDHGPSGANSGFDELNKIEKGANYGWPLIRGDETQEGLQTPVIQSGARDTWAPAGLAYADGSLYFSGLRGRSLYQVKVSEAGDVSELHRHLSDRYGRLRSVEVQGDSLIISTSNTDGRGNPRAQDDKLLEVPLELLN